MSATSFNRRLLSLLVGVALASTAVRAIGDFPCAGSSDSKSCADWSVDPDAQGTISPTATCKPDPIGSGISYCGYANSPCTTADDCDYGSCGTDGFCKGYLGDTCTDSLDCQAFFSCGTDGTCGGLGAGCANGDASAPIPQPNEQCTSQTCDTTAMTCSAAPHAGMPTGSPCASDDVCESSSCDSTTLTCSAGQTPAAAAAAATKSANTAQANAAVQSASRKKKRFVLNGSGPNTDNCPIGLTSCLVGSTILDGFECIDAESNIEQCGGCVLNGFGTDCTSIWGVEGVLCNMGQCEVTSCMPGLRVNWDKSACV